MNATTRSGWILAWTLGLVGLPSHAAEAPVQAVPEFAEAHTMANLPDEIRDHLRTSHHGDISDRGGPFSPGCLVVPGQPMNRFAGARVGKDLVLVSVERGGLAHYVDTLAYRQVDGHWTPEQGRNGLPPPAPPRPGAPGSAK